MNLGSCSTRGEDGLAPYGGADGLIGVALTCVNRVTSSTNKLGVTEFALDVLAYLSSTRMRRFGKWVAFLVVG